MAEFSVTAMKPLLLLLVMVGVSPAGLLAAAAPKAAPAVEAPLTMSPFEVQAMSADFRRWIKVGSPNFIIYTDAKPAEASAALREMEMLHAAAQRFFGRRALNLHPVTLILPTARSDWRQLQSKGGVEWEVAVSGEAVTVTDLIVVQYDWQDHGLSTMRSAQAGTEAARLNLYGPFWFEYGLHNLLETAEFNKDVVGLGRANSRSLQLERGGWVPWGRFFEVTPASPEFRKESLVGPFTAQTTVFMHYLFTNPDRAWIGRLSAWLDYLNAGHAPTEAEFKAIFTQDWKTWQRTMETYTKEGSYRIYNVKVPPEAVKFPETKYELPVREMRDLFVLGQILVQDVPASETALDEILAKGLKTASLRELLAAACIRRKRPEAALPILRKLIEEGSKNPRVYNRAASLLTERNAPKLSLDARLGEEVVEARRWCQRALELEPFFREANFTLAWIEALAPEVDQQGIATIETLYRRTRGALPSDELIMPLAVALWRVGDTATARQLCAKLKDEALATKQSRELAKELFDRLNPGAAVQPAPAAVRGP